MNTIKDFSCEKFGTIRIYIRENGEPWFVGKDVAEKLGYKDASKAVWDHVAEDDKTTFLIQKSGSNYKSKTMFINESGLYSLILASKLPQEKAFKHWVTNEVLPQIRKTGGYIPVEVHDDEKTILCKAIGIMKNTIDMLTPKADYTDRVLRSPTCYTMTQVAKGLSMTVNELTYHLHRLGIIYRSPSVDGSGNNVIMLYAQYLKQGLEAYRTDMEETYDGVPLNTSSYLVWTEKGRQFINGIFQKQSLPC